MLYLPALWRTLKPFSLLKIKSKYFFPFHLYPYQTGSLQAKSPCFKFTQSFPNMHKRKSSKLFFPQYPHEGRQLEVNSVVRLTNFQAVHFANTIQTLYIGRFNVVIRTTDFKNEVLSQEGLKFQRHGNHLIPYNSRQSC